MEQPCLPRRPWEWELLSPGTVAARAPGRAGGPSERLWGRVLWPVGVPTRQAHAAHYSLFGSRCWCLTWESCPVSVASGATTTWTLVHTCLPAGVGASVLRVRKSRKWGVCFTEFGAELKQERENRFWGRGRERGRVRAHTRGGQEGGRQRISSRLRTRAEIKSRHSNDYSHPDAPKNYFLRGTTRDLGIPTLVTPTPRPPSHGQGLQPLPRGHCIPFPSGCQPLSLGPVKYGLGGPPHPPSL